MPPSPDGAVPTQAKKRVVIVGAGIAGLATGIYSAMNGYDSVILEQSHSLGGICQGWRRKGYMCDGCCHWLVGSNAKPSVLGRFLRDVGLGSLHYIDPDEYVRYEVPGKPPVIFYSNLDRLSAHLKHVASLTATDPDHDYKVIDTMIGICRRFVGADIPVYEPTSAGEGIRFMRGFGPLNIYLFMKWSKVTMDDFASRFTSPVITAAFRYLWPPVFPVAHFLMTLAMMHRGSCGFPVGGAQAITNCLVARFRALSGRIELGSTVSDIQIEGSKVTGVSTKDGRVFQADHVVWGGDGRKLLFDLLKQRYMNSALRQLYNSALTFKGVCCVTIGLKNCTLSTASPPTPPYFDTPHARSAVGDYIALDPAPVFAGETIKQLQVHERGEESGLILPESGQFPAFSVAGPGVPHKATITVMYESAMSAWLGLTGDLQLAGEGGPASEEHAYARSPAYQAEKARLGRFCLEFCERRFGREAMGEVEMLDVATPLTYHRYTRNYNASSQGWVPTPQNWSQNVDRRVPGLPNLYMAGQWVMIAGGIPPAIMCANSVVKMICRTDKKQFVAKQGDTSGLLLSCCTAAARADVPSVFPAEASSPAIPVPIVSPPVPTPVPAL
ncbi:putative phytoene desaturase [Paratrimastix pyriformis]|uniref:Phytoene desaturase n=1 Tax=Paratrimastix pyriformis TaxID=342808 RepID=A0ABQ8UQD9_9EUKA|nr:putative phytoene desaturase [Paratrimastix pyriformis]|eukprot:GAFH01000891.1.p1 GENE.GAFH01000891.1~~GAFH01000891.1.p1  ORF type:complete len:625 (+),score=120.24 GAFH01000891.1:40-1875(+)